MPLDADRRASPRPDSRDRRRVPRLALPETPAPEPWPPPPPRLPPGPRAPAFVQTLNWIARPIEFMEGCRRRYGDSFTVRLGPRVDVVLLADPADVKRVFQGHPEQMHMGDVNGLFRPILGSGSMLLLDGADHLRQRRLLLPPFHGAAIARYAELMEEIVEEEIAGWPLNRRFSLGPGMQAITLNVILRAVFGLHGGERRDRLRALLSRLLELCLSRSTMLPQLRRELGGRSPWGRLMRCVADVDVALYDEIARRRAAGGGGEDVLSLLLEARDEEGQPLSDRELRDELLTLLVAGHETTANALAWAFERLLRHPDALERLTAELDRGEERYLEATIKETLRLRPVLPIVARKLTAAYELRGWRYPAGTVLMPCVYLVHHNEDVYPNAGEFLPERWLERQPPTYGWIPFGGGVRRCLGASFALMEMRVVLRTVLTRMQLAPVGGAESVKRRSFTFAPRRDCSVVASRREEPLGASREASSAATAG